MTAAVAQKLSNTIFIDDNLNVLARIPDRSVDLIATDPPFNTARFQSTKTNQYSDIWRNGQVFSEAVEAKLFAALIPNKQKVRLQLLLDQAQGERVDGVPEKPTPERSFLAFMALRAIEMRRVLKDEGSIYWHCDPKMSHYLKVLLDIVFGANNFRNEIVWAYTGPSNTKRWFPQKHDILLFYSKSNNWIFNADDVLVPYSDEYVKRFAKQYNEGTGKSTIFQAGHNTERNQALASRGKLVEDWWADCSPVGRLKDELIGYPTQKPLALYERIIKASSEPGQLVLDPFCGCATTPIAALKTGRRFIGVDVNGVAMRLISRRIGKQIEQGNLLQENKDINRVVNYQLIQDSIDELNGLIGGGQTKDAKLEVLEKYKEDRNYLQQIFDNQKDYPEISQYLEPVAKPTLTTEKPLSAAEKEDWKEKAIKEGTNKLTGYFQCPGFWSKGKQFACRNNGGKITPNKTNLETDRIIPASFGGDYTLSNIRLLCNQCNRRRSDRGDPI